MSGFVKIYGSILRSSVWLEDAHTRLLWIALLAMADSEGFVDGAVPGIAHAANLPLDAVQRGLEILQRPDPHSKDPDHEGRRVQAVPGGVRVLNYTKYRESRSPEQVRSAARVQRWRERQRGVTGNACNAGNAQKQKQKQSTEVQKQRSCSTSQPRTKREAQRVGVPADAATTTHTRSRAHAKCHPEICRALGAPTCLNREHVEELGAAVLNYEPAEAISQFAAFIRQYASDGQPMALDADVFRRGRYLWDTWVARLGRY
ncbi:MAG: hypothetical protein IT177_00840 [Acidobacteria bacterium]|nr:hypothetical protein [Acidobacteriota bacterium]